MTDTTEYDIQAYKFPAAPDYATKMDPAVKMEWVAALRSGDYEQGHGQLRSWVSPAGRYCCLGVLCDVGTKLGALEHRPAYAGNGPGWRLPRLFGGWSEVMPSRGICEWAGLPAGSTDDLAEANDSGRYTFAQIADYIEENL